MGGPQPRARDAQIVRESLAGRLTSMLLLSGDMLPLQSFQAIRQACTQTQLSLQPGVGLNERQQKANDQRYTTIAP